MPPRAQSTPPVQILVGTRVSLSVRSRQPIEERARHLHTQTAMLTERLIALGFVERFPAISAGSPVVALVPPCEPHGLRSKLEQAGYAIAGGLGEMAESAVRIALLGELTEADLDGFVDAVARVLHDHRA